MSTLRTDEPHAVEVATAIQQGDVESLRRLLRDRDRGADPDWVGYDGFTPLDAARREGADEVVAWLRSRGARPADELS